MSGRTATASEFTSRALAKPFTVHTRWRSLFGERWLAAVVTRKGEDRAEMLVSQGLARLITNKLIHRRDECTRAQKSRRKRVYQRMGRFNFRIPTLNSLFTLS